MPSGAEEERHSSDGGGWRIRKQDLSYVTCPTPTNLQERVSGPTHEAQSWKLGCSRGQQSQPRTCKAAEGVGKRPVRLYVTKLQEIGTVVVVPVAAALVCVWCVVRGVWWVVVGRVGRPVGLTRAGIVEAGEGSIMVGVVQFSSLGVASYTIALTPRQ